MQRYDYEDPRAQGSSGAIHIFDRTKGIGKPIATTDNALVAGKIVDALNAMEPK
jgi:hypothetical protein